MRPWRATGARPPARFPIPMRGNERLMTHDPTEDATFPIPMRGNEITCELVHFGSDGAFPIPMRGNEIVGGMIGEVTLAKVSDPHEG